MENNAYENGFAPEAEAPQQPVENQQPAENKPDFAGMVNDAVEKGKDLLAKGAPALEKVKALPKKIWIMAGAAVVAIIAVIVVLSLLGNTYKAPIQAAEKLLNTRSVEKIVDRAPTLLNGFGEAEAKDLIKIIKKSDQYKDTMEDAEDAFSDAIDDLKDEYGNNFKISLKVEEKEKLEKEDVREFRDQLRDISELADQLKDMDSDDYEDMADDLGISKSQAKDMVKSLESFCKKCKSAKVKAGYELSVVATLTGSELDEPEEEELTVRVFKVDGRWVPDVFSLMENIDISDLLSMVGGL